jgi:hypothetical protein
MSQTCDPTPRRKAWDTPHLKLYGSVQALTASGTGMVNEAFEGAAAAMACQAGMLAGSMARKHCV